METRRERWMEHWLHWLIWAALKLAAGLAIGIVVLGLTAIALVLLALWQLCAWLEGQRDR